jgi:hypothetical protein
VPTSRHPSKPKRGKPGKLDALLARVEALEERVGRIESGKAAPGDGRAAIRKQEAGRYVKRCPGCGLPLRRRKGRCAACDRPLD